MHFFAYFWLWTDMQNRFFFNFRPDNRIITFAPPSASISPFPVRFAQVNSTCLARNLIFYLRVALLVKPIYYRFVHTSSTHGPHIVHTWSTHKVHIKGYLSIYTLLGIFPMSKKLHVFEVPCHACQSPMAECIIYIYIMNPANYRPYDIAAGSGHLRAVFNQKCHRLCILVPPVTHIL